MSVLLTWPRFLSVRLGGADSGPGVSSRQGGGGVRGQGGTPSTTMRNSDKTLKGSLVAHWESGLSLTYLIESIKVHRAHGPDWLQADLYTLQGIF